MLPRWPQVINPTYWQRLLRLPPEVAVQKSVFMHDFYNAFTSVVFYGNELRLAVFEALLFLAIDSQLQSVATTAFIVYIVIKAVALARYTLGKNNLSRKTQIDQRFLN